MAKYNFQFVCLFNQNYALFAQQPASSASYTFEFVYTITPRAECFEKRYKTYKKQHKLNS